MKISNFSFGAPPQIGLFTICLRFPKNVPVISQKVAQKLLFLMKVAQSRLKKVRSLSIFAQFFGKTSITLSSFKTQKCLSKDYASTLRLIL